MAWLEDEIESEIDKREREKRRDGVGKKEMELDAGLLVSGDRKKKRKSKLGFGLG